MTAVAARAAWPTIAPLSSTVSTAKTRCTPFTLPAHGVIDVGASLFITLTSSAVFQPECTPTMESSNLISTESSANLRDPFYASTIPQVYVLSATTLLAYMLVIMLLITPRTFLSDGIVILGRRGFTNGPSGGDGAIGIGGRPWLQKGATLTVAISLTIATVDTFRVAQSQYNTGYMDATALQSEVLNGLELLIIRTISITFLWLAQAQTLIRLFPRQREKIIIKWTAFALILLELIFECLNNFLYRGYSRPHNFTDVIPALTYIFELALSLLYCAWVIYYGLTKRKYAWYHPQMRNICLMAFFSLAAILVPVIFFCLDMADPDAASWGDYVRWVGAAAASVVVWEWVERIEALERNDRKDGVLGREIFDGDEMLEVTPSTHITRPRPERSGGLGAPDGGNSTGTISKTWPAVAGIANRYRTHIPQHLHHRGHIMLSDRSVKRQLSDTQLQTWPPRPASAATPVSRTDTASAGSTEYAIRYHPTDDHGQSVGENSSPQNSRTSRTSRGHDSFDIEALHVRNSDGMNSSSVELDKHLDPKITGLPAPNGTPPRSKLIQTFSLRNPFRKRLQHPPAEVSAQLPGLASPHGQSASIYGWNILTRLEEFASTTIEKLVDGSRVATQEAAPLPVTRIPVPQRRRQNIQHIANPTEEADEADTYDQEVSRARTIPTEIARSPTSKTQNIYTPSESNRASIAHRGSLSFVTTIQQGSDRQFTAAGQTSLKQNQSQPADAQNSPHNSNQTRHSASPGLPVVRIPAPPRRERQG